MNNSANSPGTPQRAPGSTGEVVANALYRLDEAKSRMGWRDAGFRAAVRAGLRVHRAGKRLYVLGADLIAYVTKANGGDR